MVWQPQSSTNLRIFASIVRVMSARSSSSGRVGGCGTAAARWMTEVGLCARSSLSASISVSVARSTQIPLELKTAGEVVWSLWSPSGACLVRKDLGMCAPGPMVIDVDFNALGMPPASYLYQVEVFNASGRFSDVKRMTLLK